MEIARTIARVLGFICVFILFSPHLWAQEGTSKEPVRLITYNVWYGFTQEPDRKTNWIRWMIYQDPDIVCLQELNEYTDVALERDAAQWGHDYSVLLKEDGFPTGITSRYPIEDVVRIREGFHHGLLRVKILGVYVYVMHLHPSNWKVRNREMQLILDDISQLPSTKVVLAGDFNTFSPLDSGFYLQEKLEPFFASRDSQHREENLRNGKLDYQVIADLTAAGFVDTEAHFRSKSYKFTGTFPTEIEKEGEHGDPRRLDYVFVHESLVETVLSSQIMRDPVTLKLSDHLPVITDFSGSVFKH